MKCTEDEIKQKYDEYRNIRLEEIKNQYNNYIAEQTELTNLLAHINSITDYNSHIINIKNKVIIDLKESSERLLMPKIIPSFARWKNDIIEEYKYQIHRYESDIVTYEVKLDRFKKLLNLLKEVNNN